MLLTLIALLLAAGPQVTSFFSGVDDSDQPYGLYLPKDFDPAKKYPLVISLHGAGSNHRLNLRRVFGQGNRPGESDGEATRHFPPLKDIDYIVASPLARGTMGYQGIAERDVLDVLADVKKRFPIDADTTVPVEVSRRWTEKLKEPGAPVEYIEYAGIKHNSWDSAYREGAIFDWFARFGRDRFPERVRFVARSYRHAGGRVAGAWKPGRFAPAAGGKRPGAEGPIAEAAAAAEWSSPRSRLQLNLRVLADQEVRDSDLAGASLVLFGTPATNLWIRKFTPRLPLELNAGAADYCLLFVAQVEGRLVLVNSGLPWWTGAEFAKRPGFRFIGTPYRLLLGFGDYLLFKGSLENVVAEGRFDAGWRVPPADAEKILATGAVAVRAK